MTALAHAEDGNSLLLGQAAVPEAGSPMTGVTLPHGALSKVAVEADDGGIIRITLVPGGHITSVDGAYVQDRYLSLTGGAGGAVLLEITGVESVSRDAFRFLSEAVTVTAFAILGSTAVDRVIAHGRRGLPEPTCPSRYFTDKQEALAWLRGPDGLH